MFLPIILFTIFLLSNHSMFAAQASDNGYNHGLVKYQAKLKRYNQAVKQLMIYTQFVGNCLDEGKIPCQEPEHEPLWRNCYTSAIEFGWVNSPAECAFETFLAVSDHGDDFAAHQWNLFRHESLSYKYHRRYRSTLKLDKSNNSGEKPRSV